MGVSLALDRVVTARFSRGVMRLSGIFISSFESTGGGSLLRLSGTLFFSLGTNSKSNVKLLRKLMNLSNGLLGASIVMRYFKLVQSVTTVNFFSKRSSSSKYLTASYNAKHSLWNADQDNLFPLIDELK
ncbi:Protein patched-like protein 1 [Frankliniella fusca]|uniref:Protein patched-like protein 1 n=1 Tax=Frankliniella fusca TaxID=407009 RepID=A0AAE1GWQ9_9NEOP|nr:Protein patched-like protein 1 [Frankliniella fusca]